MRQEQINVRVSDAEYDAIYIAAQRLSMSPSAYLRHVALHALPMAEIGKRLSALEARVMSSGVIHSGGGRGAGAAEPRLYGGWTFTQLRALYRGKLASELWQHTEHLVDEVLPALLAEIEELQARLAAIEAQSAQQEREELARYRSAP